MVTDGCARAPCTHGVMRWRCQHRLQVQTHQRDLPASSKVSSNSLVHSEIYMIQNTALYFSDGLSFTLEAKSRWKIKKELVGFLAGYCPACLVLGWVPCVYPAGLALGGIVWHHHCLVSTRLGRMALPSLLSTRLGSMARSSWLSIRQDSMASSLPG